MAVHNVEGGGGIQVEGLGITYGKGTYGNKVGRPSTADKKDPKMKKAAMKKMSAKKKK